MKRTQFPFSGRFKSIKTKARQAQAPGNQIECEKRRKEALARRLKNAPLFNHKLNLPSPDKQTAKKLLQEITDVSLIGKVGESRILSFEILCANLIEYPKVMRLPMSSNKWTKAPDRLAGQFVREIIPVMKENELIVLHTGQFFNNKRKLTRIEPTKSFLARFSGAEIEEIPKQPQQLIILREGKGDQQRDIKYVNTAFTRDIKRILRQANEVNQKAVILDRDKKPVGVGLHSVFSEGSFDRGGRLYTSGRNSLQSIPNKKHNRQRLKITINGNSVVELDYSALHPRMLYAMQQEQYPLDKDLYLDIYNNKKHDQKLRNVFKLIVMNAIGSLSKIQAVKSGNLHLKENYDSLILMRGAGLTVKQFLNDFEKKHPKIKYFFYRDLSGTLQNRDCKMALDILEYFTSRGIPCLPLHDSFIVEEHYEGELRHQMDIAFSARNNGFKCPIDKKI